jgi:hypothetical protein
MSEQSEPAVAYNYRHRNSDSNTFKTYIHPRPISETHDIAVQSSSKSSAGDSSNDHAPQHAIPHIDRRKSTMSATQIRSSPEDITGRAYFFDSQSVSSDIVAKMYPQAQMVSEPRPLTIRKQQINLSGLSKERKNSLVVKTPQNSATLQDRPMELDTNIINPLTAHFRDPFIQREYRKWTKEQEVTIFNQNSAIGICTIVAFLIAELCYGQNGK